MHWPLASQFSATLQRPEIAFRDPVLKRYHIERDRFGQPRPWTGAFAAVYKAIPPDGGPPKAIRVFTTASPERRERYDAISEYLRNRPVKCLVDFEYRDESIRAAGHPEWFPLILMDWVQGETLYGWVRARCQAGDRSALASAAARWIDLIAELEDARIAHGDLQHANVMVTPSGELKLVDYDGMCVPALVGRRNLEIGIKPYQHPDRNEQTPLSLELDRFSALVIYVALRALAADCGLWQTYVEASQYDKLLFRNEDLLSPAASRLIADLRNCRDVDLWDLVEQLLQFVRGPMAQVPALREAVQPSFRRIEGLLEAGEYQAAVELLNRRGQFRDAPERLKPRIQQAYHFVCRKEAWEAFEKLPREAAEEPDRALVKAWNEALFSGFPPAEQQRARVEAARQRIAVLDRLEELLRQAGRTIRPATESALASCAAELPAGYAYRLRSRVEQARQRVLAFEYLREAIDGGRTEEEVVAAWQRLKALGCFDWVGPTWRRRVELAARRVPVIRAIRAIPATLPPDQFDRRILSVWHENLLAGCAEVDAWRPAYELALRRRQLLGRVVEAVRLQADTEIVRLTEDPCLAQYPLPREWSAAIHGARDRVAKTQELIAALESGDAARFYERFDARLIRRHGDLFARHEERLRRWVEAEILPLERLGLGPALARRSLVCVEPAQGVFRVRWTWPQPRFAEKCLLAICPQPPSRADEPERFPVYYRLPIDRAHWEAGGGDRLLHVLPDWGDGCVVVWALVDVGLGIFPSPPLMLGYLKDAPGTTRRLRKGWSWFLSLGQNR